MSPSELEFSIKEVLATGNLAIDASAGTGKTYTLADLTTRSIAEGTVTASELLVVTFTRAATGELRWRVRERLIAAAECLRAGTPPPDNDVLMTHLWSFDHDAQLERIARALSEFDAATIATIHGFASLVLGSLGATAGTDPDSVLAEDGPDLVASACADVLAAAAAAGESADVLPSFTRLRDGTKAFLAVTDMVLYPDPGDQSAPPGDRMLSTLIGQASNEVVARRRAAGTLSYDDLLTEVRAALKGPGAAAVVGMLRDRYKLALIDEFQDTDAVQWDIFSTLFDAGVAGSSLVLVGDPKQAIYSFRGANVHTYLDAVGSAGLTRRTLKTNWRSDGAVVNSLYALLRDVTFGDDDIDFDLPRVDAAHETLHLSGRGDVPVPALSLRLAVDDDIPRTSRGAIVTPDAERAIYLDLVAQTRELLDHAHLPYVDADGKPLPVVPSNIAVLVKTGKEARQVQSALIDQGIPAVLARGESVLLSEAAEQWRWLLWAVERPADPRRARALALSWFGGWSAQEVGEAPDEAFAGLQAQIVGWGETLTRHGVASFVRQVWTESGIPARVLTRLDGDRAMTDLQHVGELLQAAPPSVRSSVAGLLSVLETEPIGDADAEEFGDVTARRIESEANAVQVMTVWVAKGLEFEVVLLPTLWRTPTLRSVIFQSDAGDRTLDVTLKKEVKAAKARGDLARQEVLGEQLRLLYVALTRAKHHTVLWWTNVQRSESSALAHVLFARSEGMIDKVAFDKLKVSLPSDADTYDELAALVRRSEGSIVSAVHGVGVAPATRWESSEATGALSPLALATLTTPPDRSRNRWSFTALTNAGLETDPYDPSVSDGGADDESGDEVDEVETDIPTPAFSPMDLLPAGAEFGTLVHSVLERVDFRADPLAEDIGRAVDLQLERSPVDLTPPVNDMGRHGRDLLVTALTSVIEAPMVPDLRLRDLGADERINEMSFEIGLGGAGEHATLRQMGELLVRHLPETDPFTGWAKGLITQPSSIVLAGHLTGSIDLIFRSSADGGAPRFYVADYKTNRLGRRGQPPKSDDYDEAHMVDAMVEHHYPLQALLYMVALHRYLRWRLPDYDPDRHLGGAVYLFVRGMTGPELTADGQARSVLTWHPPSSLVVAVSDLLNGSAPGLSA